MRSRERNQSLSSLPPHPQTPSKIGCPHATRNTFEDSYGHSTMGNVVFERKRAEKEYFGRLRVYLRRMARDSTLTRSVLRLLSAPSMFSFLLPSLPRTPSSP